LSLLAQARHPHLRLEPGDTVLLSSRIIPGNERAVSQLLDALWRLGVTVQTRASHPAIHTSGHGSRAELRELIELVRPEIFIPVHGSRHQLEQHAALARELGVPEVLVIENGEPVQIGAQGRVRRLPALPLSPVAMAPSGVLPPQVLSDRRKLGRAGAVLLAVAFDRAEPAAAAVEVTTIGVVANAELITALEHAARRALEQPSASGRPLEAVRAAVEYAARGTVRARLGERPFVLVALSRLEGPRRL